MANNVKDSPEKPNLEEGLEVFRLTVEKGNVWDIGQIAMTLIQSAREIGFAASREVSQKLFQIFVEETHKQGFKFSFPFFIASRDSPDGILFANDIVTITDVTHFEG